MNKKQRLSKLKISAVAAALSIASSPILANHNGEHFGYDNSIGNGTHTLPPNWGAGADEIHGKCQNKFAQSPIDLARTSITKNTGDNQMQINYFSSKFNVVANGRGVEFKYPEKKGGSLYLNTNALTGASVGPEYFVEQFHFHGPSEHEIAKKSYAMEMHIVHKNDAGEYVVLAVMIKPDYRNTTNNVLAPIWDNVSYFKLPRNINVPLVLTGAESAINVENALPGNRDYYQYNGSLTTPGCDEGVKWRILTTPITMSWPQINAFKDILTGTCCTNGNNRPIQN